MLRELLTVFRGDNQPLAAMAENFRQMLALSLENTLFAGKLLFDQEQHAEDRSEIYKKDIQINKLERKIRKQVVAHLSFKGNIVNVPYCLMIFSLAKDAERLGDYAKNLTEIIEFRPGGLPTEDDRIQELNEIRKETEGAFSAASKVLESRDRELAQEYILAGRDVAHRCEALLARLARSDFEASTTTAAVLATRYYKRVGGHVINILSSVVMPLHKVDYYDESALLTNGDS
jgi:phosphate transport system protein